MPYLAAALLTLVALLAPAAAFGQAGVSYGVPADNPFVSEPGAAPEVYALGLRNPYRFSFDRATGDLVIGDVGQSAKEEVDWIGADAVRGANFGWPCREGTVAGHRPDQCPVPGAIEPLFEYDNTGGTAVIGGFVVHDPSLTGLEGRYLYADFSGGNIHSLALNFADPDDQATGLAVPWVASFGEDADGRLYAASLGDGRVVRLVAGAAPGTLNAEDLTGPFDSPVALATYPGDSSRLFVGQLGGQVRLVVNGAARATPFLDLSQFGLLVDGERGLLSLVAAPDYETSGRIYVYYTVAGGDIQIDEFTRSAADPETADPASRRCLLTIEHSSEFNHNGGQMQFGPDGYLWISTGDGGGVNDPHDNAQNKGSLLGKILRIDPHPPGAAGAPCPVVAAPGPEDDPTAPHEADRTAPGVSARAPRHQRVLRRDAAIAYARCSEDCRLSAGGTLLVAGRRLLLRRATATLAAGRRARLAVRLRPRQERLLRQVLRNHRHPRIMLRLRASDAAGNRSAVVRRGVRVR